MGKTLIKGIIACLLVLSFLLIGINGYFRLVFPIKQKLSVTIQMQIKDHNIHSLTYSQIPTTYRNGVIATEDQRFSWDPGIDPLGIARSLVVDVKQGKFVEGGSTITQQLVDNTFIKRKKSLSYKLRQAAYAIGIYDTVAKPTVFAMYANIIYFGHGAYGLYNAAQVYFGKTPDKLNKGELTMLAGLPNAPSVYDPFKNMKLAKKRQAVVVNNMVDAHMISKRESELILKQPILLMSKH